MNPVDCTVDQLLINIVGSEGRSNAMIVSPIAGMAQHEKVISWDQLPDDGGTYTVSVQALASNRTISQSDSDTVGKQCMHR